MINAIGMTQNVWLGSIKPSIPISIKARERMLFLDGRVRRAREKSWVMIVR